MAMKRCRSLTDDDAFIIAYHIRALHLQAYIQSEMLLLILILLFFLACFAHDIYFI